MAYIKNYFTPESCDKLIQSLYYAEDSIKYLLNLPQNQKDSKYLTPELFKAFADLSETCKELVAAYNYYIKAEHWKAKNETELAEITARAIADMMIASGKNPTEALTAVKKMFDQEAETLK